MQYTEKIERYLAGEMTAQEAAAFEQQVKTDSNLAYEVKLHQLAIAGVQHDENARFQDFKARMKAIEEEEVEESETPVVSLKPERPNMIRRLFAVAAMFVLVLAAYLLWPKTAANPMASLSKELIAFNESGTKGTAPDTPKTALQEGIQLFKNKEYKAAISLFDQVIQGNPDKRATAQFLKADALYRLGNKAEANTVLQSIRKVDDERIYRSAQAVLSSD